jgi:hypothetical protein
MYLDTVRTPFIPLVRQMCRSSLLISVSIVCQVHNEVVVSISCVGKVAYILSAFAQ